MKLQLKRSNVLELGSAKEPTADQMEYGELAVNYNESDPAIFLKDSNDNIIRISGADNISIDGQVTLPSTPSAPSPAESGNLWYNSVDGRLYIYYVDQNTEQWVDASPDSWQPSIIPDTDNPSNQPGTLDDRYVNITGDDMTGNLTLGTDKITLNATNGSIDAAGSVTLSNSASSKQVNLVYNPLNTALDEEDRFSLFIENTQQTKDTALLFRSTTGGAAVDTKLTRAGVLTIRDNITLSGTDGSITAAGNILSTGTTNNDIRFQSKTFAEETFSVIGDGTLKIQEDKIVLNGSDGSGSFAGDIQSGGDPNDGSAQGAKSYLNGGFFSSTSNGATRSAFKSYVKGNSTATVQILHDGSAEFVGNIDVGTYATNEKGVRISKDGVVNIIRTGSGAQGALSIKNENLNQTTTLFSDGSATFAGGDFTVLKDDSKGAQLNVNRTTGNGSSAVFVGKLNNADTSVIRADGSATFAGRVNAGYPAPTQNIDSIALAAINSSASDASPTFFLRNYNNDGLLLEGRNGSGTTTVTIEADGSASFAGDVKIGGTLPASPNISLNANGKITAEGNVTTKANVLTGIDNGVAPLSVMYNSGRFYARATNSTDEVFRIEQSGNITPTILFKSEGSATFAGTLSASDGRITTTANGQVNIAYTSSGGDAFTIKSNVADPIFKVAATGSATFAGQIETGNISNGAGVRLRPIGDITFRRDTATDNVLGIYTGGITSSNKTVEIQANGVVKLGTNLSGASGTNITLDATDGSASFAGGKALIDSAGNYYAGNSLPGSASIIIRGADGSASFAGKVTAGGYDIDSLPSLP